MAIDTKPLDALTGETAVAKPDAEGSPAKQLALGLLFGVLFGFLLQKGGVAKFHILIGVLLLEDFTVFKVMLTAMDHGQRRSEPS